MAFREVYQPSAESSGMSALRIGTSSFTASGWRGPFYPRGMAARDYLSFYATQFDTVEIDSTFYGTPSPSTVRDWYSKTPPGFIFAAKVPQVVTHEKVLVDCAAEFDEFVAVMDNLGEKLGPLLLQFPYFQREVFAGPNEFVTRLYPFLKTLPRDHKFAIEIRNKHWLASPLFDTLRDYGVALALIDHSYMPRPRQWFDRVDPITADFTYVRWLGDRKEIEAITKVWNKTIVDRSKELAEWADVLSKVKVPIYTYANNHYSGYGPGTVEMFRNLWRGPRMERSKSARAAPQGQLFD